jgi:hypothetical protein
VDIWRTALIIIGLAGLATGCARQGALREPEIEPFAANLLMVPVDRDSGGCVRYRLISATGEPDFTVYWRIDAGHFTNNRASADCRPRESQP